MHHTLSNRSNKTVFPLFILPALFFSINYLSFGQSTAERLSGVVKDKSTDEALPGASIYWTTYMDGGVTSEVDGTFSIRLIDLPAELTVSFVGYTSSVRTVTVKDLGKDLKFFLSLEEQSLEEFVVNELRENSNVLSRDIGKNKLPVEVLKHIPALFGEVDLLRGIQLLPGVNTAGEGTTGLFIRGGSADQNLIQIDGAPIFNPSHFFGFFSVFNPDALSNVELYKGHIPARYGGRLSSLIDISLKEGNTKRIQGEGGIGSISSRLTVDGPLFSDQSSFVVSGRRTYADLFLGLSPDENIRNNQLYFYDLSGKLMFRIKDRDKITVSSYYGSDYLGTSGQFGMGWNNWISSLNWTRSIRDDLFLDVNGYHSFYKYLIAFTDENIGFDWNNNFSESGVRGEINWVPQENFHLYAGIHSQVYHFAPINLNLAPQSNLESVNTNPKTGLLNNLFVHGNYDLSPVFSIEGGLRWNHYQQIGKGVQYLYEGDNPANGSVVDTVSFGFGENMQTYKGLEPRLAARYLISERLSLKGAFNRNFQYIQIASNNSAGLPIDRWMPAGRYVSPIRSDQISLGAFKNLSENRFELSLEGYYKDFDRIIDLKQGAEILFTDKLETEILTGKGWAYGMELMVRKNVGNTTGWLSYTWSRVFRQIAGINEDQPFNPRFDRPHDVSLVLNHKVNKRLELSGTFVYTSGVAVTFPIGSYEVDNQRVPLYSPRRNEDRFPDYNRMDLSVNLKNRDRGRWWKGSWNFSVYNAYNRKNPFSYQFTSIYNNDFRFDPGPEDEITSFRPGVVMTYLFGILPSVTYNFEF
jgi:hypothetical protein